MIGTVFKISVLRLWNNKPELLLLIVVPILFFSIFALIFSRGVGQTADKIPVSIVNDDSSRYAQNLVESLDDRDEIQRVTGIGKTAENWPIERLSRTIIGRLDADIVIYIPDGFAQSLQTDTPLAIGVLHEGTNPVSSQVVEAAVARAAASTPLPVASSMPRFTLTSTQTAQTGTPYVHVPHYQPNQDRFSPLQVSPSPSNSRPSSPNQSKQGLAFERLNVFATNKHRPKIAMYAAGIAVMFVLFSCSGAGASLLEECEAGTLERLLSSRLSLNQLLVGKWLYITLLACCQITVMFLWGQLVFSVDLFGHLTGFLIMTLATSCAAASFALCLATLCRSRNQLNGVSLILVLSMSALGGSMIPRYIMSEGMQRLGRFTFNGWALDGFKKIFWYDLPVSSIKWEVTVLLGIAVGLGLVARICAQRWRFA